MFISIHSLRMEGDLSSRISVDRTDISIHSLRMEGDQEYQKLVQLDQQFQSTPSAWRETLLRLRHAEPDQLISIHSLRMEGDLWVAAPGRSGNISIHSLRMEGDEGTARKTVFSGTFQSTPSAWRETCRCAGV